MDNDKPYEVLSPTQIKLSEEAKYWAKEFNMSLNEYAEYLLRKHKTNEGQN
jgi:hypothetical protein